MKNCNRFLMLVLFVVMALVAKSQPGVEEIEEYIEKVPSPDAELEDTDVFVMIGQYRYLAKFAKE